MPVLNSSLDIVAKIWNIQTVHKAKRQQIRFYKQCSWFQKRESFLCNSQKIRTRRMDILHSFDDPDLKSHCCQIGQKKRVYNARFPWNRKLHFLTGCLPEDGAHHRLADPDAHKANQNAHHRISNSHGNVLLLKERHGFQRKRGKGCKTAAQTCL